MNGWQRAVEERIRKAMQAGDFDHLPGKGKPLNLNLNPFVDSEWRMAWDLLRSNGFTLPWLAARQEIESGLEGARKHLQRAWQRRKEKSEAGDAGPWVEAEWGQAVDRFEEQIAELNRLIFDYNLQVPAARFQMCWLDVGAELDRLTSAPDA